jgi:hypothetical protein
MALDVRVLFVDFFCFSSEYVPRRYRVFSMTTTKKEKYPFFPFSLLNNRFTRIRVHIITSAFSTNKTDIRYPPPPSIPSTEDDIRNVHIMMMIIRNPLFGSFRLRIRNSFLAG